MRTIGAAVVASVALVGLYLALGGASYAPAQVADPCSPRDRREASDFPEVAEQVILSALDGLACELGVTREEVVLALDDRNSLERFTREHGIGIADVERLARSALIRAIDDSVQAGELDADTAQLLRDLARRIPIEQLLELARFLR